MAAAGLSKPPLVPRCCRRCARTVAWLEFLAGESLDSEHQAPLASSDGVWADTRRRLDAAAATRGFAGRDAGACAGRLMTPRLAAIWRPLGAGMRCVGAAWLRACL